MNEMMNKSHPFHLLGTPNSRKYGLQTSTVILAGSLLKMQILSPRPSPIPGGSWATIILLVLPLISGSPTLLHIKITSESIYLPVAFWVPR